MKTLALVVFAALVAMAVIGAASVSATTLCKANETPCSEKNEWEEEKEGKDIPVIVKASSVEVTFGGAVATKCKKSSLSGLAIDTEQEEDNVPLEFSTKTLSFGECGGCNKVEAQGLSWEGGTLEAGEKGNGVLTLATPKIFFEKCTEKTCTASATGAALDFVGGSPAQLKAVEEPLGAGTCGKVIWTGTYKVEEPTPVWAVKE
ncbi:MAG TPA: hypothetical protein VGC63_05660 [Solirubrobacterales bacterium]|jgi:hypothetical protein